MTGKRILNILLSALLILTAVPAVSLGVYAEESKDTRSGIVLTFSDDAITETVSGSGYTISGTALNITQAGVYTLTGSCEAGTIAVDKKLSDVVLILKDLTLSSSESAPLVVKKNTNAAIHLEGTSTLSDLEDPANETSEDEAVADAFEGAAIKVKSSSSVTFCGTGTLKIRGNAKNGIKGGSGSSLIFNDGNFDVTAANNGIAADGSVVINGGTYAIETTNDGIKSVPDETDTESVGSVTINGGTFEITTDGDGIQAETSLVINNGNFTIKTFGGYSSSGFDEDTMSAKGIKASGDRSDINNLIQINGGTFLLNTRDDAIHSDADAAIAGGTFTIYTGDDGVHADASLTLGTQDGYERDPEISILQSYEGLEGGNFYIYNGKYFVTASDDGINAAGGSSNGSDPGGGGGNHFKPGGNWGGDASENYSLNVYGGTVYVDARGDGLDANGPLTLSGGEVTVFSMQAGGDNSPLDADGTITVKGAEVFCAGSNPMNENPSSQSQYCFTDRTNRAAGTVVAVKSGGSILYTAELLRRTNYILYSNPAVTSGVSLTAGGSVDACKSNGFAHSWDNGVIVKEADASSDGTMVYTCASCGETEYKRVKAEISYACSGHESASGDDGDDEEETVAVSGISLDHETLTIPAGSSETITAVISPENATNQNVTWESSNSSIAAVDENGVVTGIKYGSAVITAVTEDGRKSAQCKVNVLFSDVTDPSKAAYTAIYTLAEQNIVKGYGSYFDINNTCTRAQFVLFLWRLAGEPAPSSASLKFTDADEIKALAPDYAKAIAWGCENGYVMGFTGGADKGKFKPNDPCTRAQVVMFLWRYAGKPAASKTNLSFSDAAEIKAMAPDYTKAILWAAAEKITTGYSSDNTFRPNRNCTRGECVTFLYRMYIK